MPAGVFTGTSRAGEVPLHRIGHAGWVLDSWAGNRPLAATALIVDPGADHLRTMSFQNQRRVPFTIPAAGDESLESLMGELASPVSGLIGLEGDHLVIQVRQDPPSPWGSWGLGGLEGLLGLGTGGRSSRPPAEPPTVRETRIPLDGLASATVRGRWGRSIQLSTNDLNHFAAIPGARGDRLALSVARKHRAEAERLVHDLQMRLSDLGIAHLDREIARLEGRAIEAPDRPSEGGGHGPEGRPEGV